MTLTLRTAASLIALTLAAPALAQEAPAPTDNDDIVITAQKENRTEVTRGGAVGVLGDKDAADVPFSIKSYNAALILNQQPQTLGQVLENDPSVRTTYGFGNAAEQFVVRGFTLYGDDVGYNGLYGITPRQLVAPELYDSVQVLNGASAFLNGAAPGGSGIGGSVNLVSKRAGATPITRLTANYTSSAHIGGSFDVGRRFGANGEFGVRVNGAYRAGDVAIDNEFRRAAVLGAAIDYRRDGLRLALDLDYQRVQVRNLRPKVTLSPSLTAIPAVPKAEVNYGQRFAYTTLRDIFGSFRAEYDLAPNAMIYATVGARDGSERGIYDGVTVTNATTGDANGNDLFVPRTDNNEAATAGIRVKLAAGGISQEFNFGGSYIHQVNRNAFDFLYGPGFAGYPTNIYNPPRATLPASAFVGGNLNDPYPVGRTILGSAFASDTIGLLHDRILVTAGLRLQTIDTRAYSYYDGRGDRTSRVKTEGVSPVIGVVIKPTNGVSLFANRIEGLVQGAVAPAGTTNAGTVFPPFASTQYEAGGKLSFGRFNASVAAYTIDQPSYGSVAVGALTRFDVNGVQRNRGIELSVDGELAKGLRIIAGGSINDAKIARSPTAAYVGKRAVGVPTYLANANVEWDVPGTGLTLTGRVVNTGKQAVNPTNTLEIPSWTRFDLGARFVAVVAGKPLTLRAGVDNVANKRYWASAFDSFGAALLQGTPRTFKLSASIDL